MGPEFVVRLTEGVEDALLEIQIRGRWPSSTFFEGLVEPFVGPVLLRAAGGDALVGDAELEPPDVEAVEAMDPGGGERHLSDGIEITDSDSRLDERSQECRGGELARGTTTTDDAERRSSAASGMLAPDVTTTMEYRPSNTRSSARDPKQYSTRSVPRSSGKALLKETPISVRQRAILVSTRGSIAEATT